MILLQQGNAKAGHLVDVSNVPFKAGAILYCACMNNENIYRKYTSDKKAISSFKLMAIKRYAKLTDITKKVDNKWTRIPF